MNARSMLIVVTALGACADRAPHDDDPDHSHATDGDDLPGQSATKWTEHNELFMEYSALIVGRETGFAAHVTVLPSFKPATSGSVSVAVQQADGNTIDARADAPTSPGIFRPALAPSVPGDCAMTVTIVRDGVRDVIAIPGCRIFPDEPAARAGLGPEQAAPGRITYLKEQAWKTEFATAAVSEQELQPSVRAGGEIRAVAGKEARLSAPAPGRVVVAQPVPILGMAVRRGQLLARLAPRLEASDRSGLEADTEASQAELSAAQAQLSRAERLLAERAIPEKQVDEARTRVAVARARLAGASGRLQQYAAGASGSGGAGRGAFQIKAPLDGTLVSVNVTSGQTVQEGEPLFVVIDLARVWLEARVFEPDIPRIENARSAWFAIDGYDQPFAVDDSNGRLVTIGRMIDPQTRTVPVVFELENPGQRLRIGQYAKVWIATGAPVRSLAIPESAIVDDAGKSVAYVQVEGEAFERRPLTLGIRSRGWVEVKDGLVAGERVVTTGAYEVKLASAAGALPAHGHAH